MNTKEEKALFGFTRVFSFPHEVMKLELNLTCSASPYSCSLIMLYSKATQFLAVKAWPNACNISMQHLTTLSHDIATCVEWAG